jgi:L-aspartate oxidase
LVSTLADRVLAQPNITIFTPAFALDLWLEAGRCRGISLLYDGQITWVRATAVVLATGGGGQVYAQTTNPAVSTGDGVAIAHRARAVLRDLEFVQFHPTALIKPGAPRFLISEAVRGEGAHLIDDRGHRFAFDYHPDGELAPRDVVSRAIFSHLRARQADPATGYVWLDLSPIPADRIHHRFPNIIRVCQHWGIDLFHEPIPVAPAAHYWMGGVYTDLMTRTSIPGVYAVGETTNTGVHGANRLASNSLLECVVFGAQLAKLSLDAGELPSLVDSSPIVTERISLAIGNEQLATIHHIRQELPRLMWTTAGISREHKSLTAAISQVKTWQTEFNALPISQLLDQLSPQHAIALPQTAPLQEQELRTWGETRNLLDIGLLILTSAVFRQESRGGHFRSDFPATDPDWQVHTIVQGDRWSRG